MMVNLSDKHERIYELRSQDYRGVTMCCHLLEGEGASHVFCAKIAWEGLGSTSENNLETAVEVAATNRLRRFGEIPYTQGIQSDLETE